MTILIKNNKYYCRFQINGERHFYLCNGAVTKQEALKIENGLKYRVQQVQNGVITLNNKMPAVKLKTLYRLFDNYAKINKRSYVSDVYMVKILKSYFPDNMDAAKIKPSHIEKFKQQIQQERNSSNPTVNKYLNILSKMFVLGIGDKLLQTNPVRQTKRLKEPNYKVRYLTIDEENRLFSVLADNYPYLIPIVKTALHTGMRKSEILNLKWDNIDFQYSTIDLLETKSGKERKIPINDTLMTIFKTLPKTDKYVFINSETGEPYKDIHKSFKSALKEAKIKNFRFHDLRHSVGTRLSEKGVPLVIIKEILGHSKIETTMRYTHAVTNQKMEAMSILSNYK